MWHTTQHNAQLTCYLCVCSRCNKGLYKSKGWDDIDRRAARNADVIMAEIDGDSDGVLTEQEFIIGISSRDNLVCLIFGNELSQ